MGPGYFGKFPSHGDFISRRLPREGFLDTWDRWLQSAIAASREQLGEAWLPTYLTSPVWRFALSAGICGPSSWAGIMMPSVDSVGRYFPLSLAAELDEIVSPLQIASSLSAWFVTLEDMALSALEDPFDLQEFDRRIATLSIPSLADAIQFGHGPANGPGSAPLYVALDAEQNPAHAYPTILDQLLRNTYANYSLWWTSGSDHVAPCLIACGGLPPARGYTALLAGNWSEAGWHIGGEVNAVPNTTQPPADEPT